MNRSQRRAAVIRSIAAGLLCAGVGLGVVAPALADTAGDDGAADSSNHIRGGTAVTPDAGDSAPASVRRGIRPAPVTDNPQWQQGIGWDPDWHWPCDIVWPPWPNWPVMLSPLMYRVRTSVVLFPHSAVTVPSSPPVAFGVPHASIALGAAAAEAPESAPPAAVGAAAPLSVAAPLAPPPPAPVTPQPAPVPESVAPKPNSLPNPFPSAVPSVNLHEVAAAALPGLVGIAALTALGGLLGYRQAKAGYVLRAAGTARFLQ